jgi:hypothetical protein
MPQSPESPKVLQLRGHIGAGKDSLYKDDPEYARTHFEEALKIVNPPPEWAIPEIRQALKNYIDRLTKNRPADLDDKAQTAFSILRHPELQNDETLAWERDFKMTRARFLFESKQIDQSFDTFPKLLVETEQPEIQRQIKANFSRLAGSYVSQCIDQEQWSEPRRVFECLQTSWPPTDELSDWLAIVSRILATVHEQGEQIKQLSDQNQDLTQVQRRGLNFARVVLVIFIVAAVAYTLVDVL